MYYPADAGASARGAVRRACFGCLAMARRGMPLHVVPMDTACGACSCPRLPAQVLRRPVLTPPAARACGASVAVPTVPPTQSESTLELRCPLTTVGFPRNGGMGRGSTDPSTRMPLRTCPAPAPRGHAAGGPVGALSQTRGGSQGSVPDLTWGSSKAFGSGGRRALVLRRAALWRGPGPASAPPPPHTPRGGDSDPDPPPKKMLRRW